MRDIVLILAIFYGSTMLACECSFIDVRKNYKKADVVFYGEVIDIMDKSIEGWEDTLYSMNDSFLKFGGSFPMFKVIKINKGKKKRHFEENKILIHQDWSTCDISFKVGQTFLILAYLDSEGNLKTSMCSGSSSFKIQDYEKNIESYLKKS
ncbi:hypothetical protein ACNR9Q_17360 [Maribacter sp. X9]|uniref:hypothetical protein n=1 Tax=Maribacter sp. X9 TaxID=3402159 RepID=UPI003AF3BB13